MLALSQLHLEGEAVVQLVGGALHPDGSMAEARHHVVAWSDDKQAGTDEVLVLGGTVDAVGGHLGSGDAAAQQAGAEDMQEFTEHRGRSVH